MRRSVGLGCARLCVRVHDAAQSVSDANAGCSDALAPALVPKLAYASHFYHEVSLQLAENPYDCSSGDGDGRHGVASMATQA